MSPSVQRGIRCGQRGAKWQPAGRFVGFGTVPSMVWSRSIFLTSASVSYGTDRSRPSV